MKSDDLDVEMSSMNAFPTYSICECWIEYNVLNKTNYEI